MDDPDPDVRVGTILDGRYRILQRMAEGSMGVVYRGERVPVGKPVAVKFLHAAFAADPEFLQRFERETRVMSKLTHPHCVSVVDFGVSGSPYMVMDFVTGVTLRELLDDGPLPWLDAVTLMRQLLAGLAHAHQQGIVHRDVKPANVMVSEEIGTGRHVRILDFGLARLRGTAAHSVTQSLVVVGTPNYMAPEQTVADETDARTDIYAAGIILFEMIAGRRPFSAAETMELFNLHRSAPIPRLRDAAKDVDLPAGIDDIVRKAMAKDRKDRFASAVEFAEALDSMVARTEGGVRRASTQGVRRAASPLAVDTGDVMASADASRGSSSSRGWLGSIVAGVALATAIAGGMVLALRKDQAKEARTLPSATPPADVAPAPLPAAEPTAPVATAPAVTLPTIEVVDAGASADAAEALALIADAAVAVEDAAAAVAVPPALADAGAAVEPLVVAPAVPKPEDGLDEPDVAAGEPEGESEAPDAPASAEAAEAREAEVTVRVAPAGSIAEAMQMIKRGQRQPALLGLRQLWKKNPRSAQLPYLIGNLYYDQKWWSVAMDHYRAAIDRSAAYKRNGILIRNVVHMLGSKQTRGKASWFLRKTVGRPAKPYLRLAARRDPSPAIRRSAAWLVRQIR